MARFAFSERYGAKKKFPTVLMGILFIPALIMTCVIIQATWTFNIHCGGHLYLAAHANTVELAMEKLNLGLHYIEEKGLTSGSTSLLFETPANDVGYWYKNLTACRKELEEIEPDAGHTERSNMLLKLRESLITHNDKSEHLIAPSGISLHPNRATYAWALMLAVVFPMLILCCLMASSQYNMESTLMEFIIVITIMAVIAALVFGLR